MADSGPELAHRVREHAEKGVRARDLPSPFQEDISVPVVRRHHDRAAPERAVDEVGLHPCIRRDDDFTGPGIAHGVLLAWNATLANHADPRGEPLMSAGSYVREWGG